MGSDRPTPDLASRTRPHAAQGREREARAEPRSQIRALRPLQTSVVRSFHRLPRRVPDRDLAGGCRSRSPPSSDRLAATTLPSPTFIITTAIGVLLLAASPIG